MADYDPEDLVQEPVVLVVLSTYEAADGAAPPDAAQWLCQWASESSQGRAVRRCCHLAKVKFAVFGCGNREYGAERFNAGAPGPSTPTSPGSAANAFFAARDGDESSGTDGGSSSTTGRTGSRSESTRAARTREHKVDGMAKVRRRLTGAGSSRRRRGRTRNRPACAPADDDGDAAQKKETFYDTDAEEGSGDDDDDGDEDGGARGRHGHGGPRRRRQASGEKREMVTPQLRAALTKQGYKILGSHSGVKLCRWTKAQLRGRGGCYKHSFYGIESHRCMETTPSLACANKCVFCWRHHTNPVGREWRWQMDDARGHRRRRRCASTAG